MKKIFFAMLFCLLGFVPNGFAFSDVPHAVPWYDPVHSITLTDFAQYYDDAGNEWITYCQNNGGMHMYSTNNHIYGYTSPYYISFYNPTCNSGYSISLRNYGSYWNYNTGMTYLDFTQLLANTVKVTVDITNSSNTWTFPSGGSAYGLTGTITNGQLLVPAGTNITYSLTVARSPEAGGGVASLPDGVNEDCNDNSTIRCGECQYNYCNVNFAYNSNVVLKAFPSDGYAFYQWSWNNGTNTATDNPHTFTMSGALGVTGVFKKTFRCAAGDFYQTSGTGGQCIAYVESETGIDFSVGEAWQWYQEATNQGYYVNSSTPAVSSIIVFNKVEGTALENGHVGIVTAINGNNITIQDSNWCANNCEQIQSHTVDVSNYDILGYIYCTPPIN